MSPATMLIVRILLSMLAVGFTAGLMSEYIRSPRLRAAAFCVVVVGGFGLMLFAIWRPQ